MTWRIPGSLLPLAAFLLLFLSFLHGQESPGGTNPAQKTAVFRMTDFTGKASNTDAAFQQALAAVRESISAARKRGESVEALLDLEPNATYKIARPIQLSQLEGLTIDGHGATIVNTTFQTTLQIQSCSRLTLRDLSVDYAPLPFTQGTIAAFDSTARDITVKVDPGYPDDAKFLATFHGGFFRVMDRQTRSLAAGARTFISPESVKRLGEGLFEVRLRWSANDCGPGQLPIAVGDTVAISAGYAHAIVVADCDSTSLVDFHLYASPGMGILENAGHGGMMLHGVHVEPGPKPAGATTDRLISTNSDGAHFITVERGPSFDGCAFANTSDDAINVHGFYFFVLAKTGPRTYELSPKWDVGLLAGDEVESCEKGSFRSLGQTRIVRLDKKKSPERKHEIAQLWQGKSPTTLPDTVYEIELEQDLPLAVGDALTSLSRIGAGTTIRNSSFHACARVMIKSPDSLIENNQFSYSSAVAIHAGSDIGYWAESNFAKNLTIRDNRFTHCNLGANNLFPHSDALGTIYVGVTLPQEATGFQTNFENRNITIEGNHIDDSYIYAILVTNTDGLKITGNTIGKTFLRGSAFAAGKLYGLQPNSGIFVGMCKHAEIKNNTVANGEVTKTPVGVDPSCPADTVMIDNSSPN